MCSFKLLIVEDNVDELMLCKDTVKRYKSENDRDIELVECKNLEEALQKVDNSFDGVIIDLKLGQEGNEGNKIIHDIHTKYRIPIVVLTGTPANADTTLAIIPIYTKGEIGYGEILDQFFKKYDTGVTRIFGGRGTIEVAMNKVFWNNIYPQLDSWESHVGDGGNVEKALLRFTLNHLLELLNDDSDACYPEEMYISPPIDPLLKTGSIVQGKQSPDYYVVLSPACDLAIHNGNLKTDRILVCLIEKNNTGLVARAKNDLTLEILNDDNEATIKDKR
ncbi:hypothetical protein BGV40_08730 [Methanosarcina sp. Ant1]|nr:hypothetical protein BGV40_08730 [Methanosarcina sp. Ant1]